jgi:peroxiredoxin
MKSRHSPLLTAALLLTLRSGAVAAEAHAGPSLVASSGTAGASDPSSTLHLANGDYLAGELLGCDAKGDLRWQGSAFAAPLDFPLNAVSGVSFPAGGPRPRPKGPYCLELEGGDALFGTLVGLSKERAQFESPGLGTLNIQRSAIRRLSHCREGADLVYLGPNGLLEWTESPGGAWEQDAGRLFTTRDDASLNGDLGLPKQACIEFELSWNSDPDFTWILGASSPAPQIDGRAAANSSTKAVTRPARPSVNLTAISPEQDPVFHLEVWDHQLVLLAEATQKADLVSLQKIAAGAGRCHLRMYLDQERQRAIVFGADGGQLADLAISGTSARPGTCLRLVNHHGNVRLEQLSISRWSGEPPHASHGGKSRLQRSDGSVLNGEIEKFDAAAKEFVIVAGDQKSRVPADAVESILLPSPGSSPACGLRAIFENGARLSGNLRKAENGRLWLDRPGIVEPVGIDLSALRSLVVLEDRKPISEPKGVPGFMQGDGLKLHGCLEESGETGKPPTGMGAKKAGPGWLAWRPCGSLAASPLKQEFSGRIVYRESQPPPQPSPYQPTRMAVARAGVARVGVARAAPMAVINVMGYEPSRPASPPASWKGRALYLRTGDTIPCQIERIDERGIVFHSPQFDATFVPHDKVKAVELESSLATKIDLSKRDRLLTLPRIQKDDPPTHLIRSTEGDYLRGRLVEMDDKTLTVEVRSETRRVPRDQVASIIWLDKPAKQPATKDKPATAATPSEAEKPPVATKKPSPATRVQSLRSDGNRLTFRPEKLTGATLQGTSDVLGACRVDLNEVDRLLIGQAIEQEAQALPYQRWSLQPAIEPKFAQAGAKPGIESELVGKPAPDFELETLDGQRFRLGDQRKKIVVLDFWATWCGPCMQTLPLLVPAVAKYRDRNVVLLAVNLQEAPEAIKATLSRLDLKMPVGLDHNGVVAEKYAAVAIPQTVIIDAEGNIARLFVGGGPQNVERLCEALDAILKPAAEQGNKL